jgi:hypothetical protein
LQSALLGRRRGGHRGAGQPPVRPGEIGRAQAEEAGHTLTLLGAEPAQAILDLSDLAGGNTGQGGEIQQRKSVTRTEAAKGLHGAVS